MDPTWENFTDEELSSVAREAQANADTLSLGMAEPLHALAGRMLTELARRRISQRERAC